jgi:glycosyltransferase involved in cell wall biosynthesis
MIKIVHFGKYYFPDNGGIESVTASLAKGAVAFDHEVSVVCFKKSPAKSQDLLEGVHVLRAPITISLTSQPIGIKYFFQCLSSAKEADLVHLHVPNMLGSLCALFISPNIRLLVHWHSDVINKGFFGKILRPLESALLRRANCIVATSQVYADASKALAPFRNKISVVPIGIPDKNHQASSSSLSSKLYERVNNKKIILSVGRLVPYKGFAVLIEAAKHLPKDSIVLIVGAGPLQKALQEAVEKAGVADRIDLTGRLDDSELNAIFERATLYCLPSINRAEAFGVVLLEAMAFGLPIVASDIPGSGVPWVNQHDISGLNFTSGDPIALAHACNKILESVVLRKNLALGARQRFLSEFTEDVSVKRIMDIYDRLVSS